MKKNPKKRRMREKTEEKTGGEDRCLCLCGTDFPKQEGFLFETEISFSGMGELGHLDNPAWWKSRFLSSHQVLCLFVFVFVLHANEWKPSTQSQQERPASWL